MGTFDHYLGPRSGSGPPTRIKIRIKVRVRIRIRIRIRVMLRTSDLDPGWKAQGQTCGKGGYPTRENSGEKESFGRYNVRKIKVPNLLL